MENDKKRNGFAGGLGFILAAAGSAIGLGNLWSFPHKTSQNGGAAFVFVYIFSVIVMGLVVMIAETYLGKRARANPVTAYKKSGKNLGWIGLLAVLIPFIITCYYSILGGYTVKYAVNSFGDNTTVLQLFSGSIWKVILYSAVFIALAMIIVMGGVRKGIERASEILMPILFIILLAVVIYCLCLGNGVAEGLNYYLNPDFTSLGFKGVLAAMGQAFFSLSLGMGIMVSYGSYTGENVKIGKSVGCIAFFDTLIALLGGLAIFPAIYHYQAETGVALNDGGIMLLFVSLPLVFNTLGVVGKIVSFMFFSMVVIAALTSVISLFEVVAQFIIQKFSIARKKAISIVALAVFMISVPIGISLGFALNDKLQMTLFGYNLLDFFDLMANTVLMPVCALGSCVAIGWFAFKGKSAKENFSSRYLYRKLEDEGLKLGKFGKLFAFMVKYVTPVFIAVIEIFGIIDIVFPSGKGGRAFSANGLGIVISAYAVLSITILLYFLFLKNKETGTNADEKQTGKTELSEK